MRKRTLLLSLLSGAALCFGADFWEKTKFSDWTDEQSFKILKDSPWAKSFSFDELPRGGGGGRGGPGGFGNQFQRQGGGGRGGGGGMSTSTYINISWRSALPLKQALMALKYHQEAESKPEAKALLDRKENYYVIALAGIPAGMVKTLDVFKAGAAILRKGKEPIKPFEVADGGRDAEGKPTVMVIFKRTDEITLEDKEVEFQLVIGKEDPKKKFTLKDMVYQGKLEL